MYSVTGDVVAFTWHFCYRLLFEFRFRNFVGGLFDHGGGFAGFLMRDE